jgi:hypothetical protein
VIVDGVGSSGLGFAIAHQSWHARLDPSDPTTLSWSQLPDHPGPARYRAAGGSLESSVIVHGGTSEPYNFDGLSYATAEPAPPLSDAIAFDVDRAIWLDPPR